MKFFRYVWLPMLGLIFLTACGSDNASRTSSDFLSAYLKDNKKVVVFGRIQAKEIAEKADYKHIPKANVLMEEEMKHFGAALELEQGIHFAMEGPMGENGAERVLAFAKVKNADSLSSKLAGLGLLVQEKHDFKYAQEEGMAVGVWDEVAIFEMRQGSFDAAASLNEIHEKCSGDVSEGKVAQILAGKGDMVMGISMENLYATSNTDLNKLDAAKRKELENMVTDSYMAMQMAFEDGQATMKSQNLFSDALMKRMMLNGDDAGQLLSKLGKGKARAGLALHVDTRKLDSFLKDFTPDYEHEMSAMALFGFIANASDGNYLSNMWNGNFGLVAVGDKMADGAMIPEVNFHLGLGANGKNTAQRWLTMGSPEDIQLTINDQEVTGTSKKAAAAHQTLEIPAFANNFGKKGCTAFVDFNGLNLKSMGLNNNTKFLYALESIYVEMDNNGMTMTIKGKDASKNILKQMVNVYVKELEDQVQDM